MGALIGGMLAPVSCGTLVSWLRTSAPNGLNDYVLSARFAGGHRQTRLPPSGRSQTSRCTMDYSISGSDGNAVATDRTSSTAHSSPRPLAQSSSRYSQVHAPHGLLNRTNRFS